MAPAPDDARDADPPTDRLRVLSFNTYLGRRMDEVSRVLSETEPDIAFVQELLVYRYRGWTWHQAQSLAEELGLRCQYLRLVWRRGTDIGLAVLTRGTIGNPMPIQGPPHRPTGFTARVEVGDRAVNVAAVHFTSVPRPLILGYPLVMPMHRRQTRWSIDQLDSMGGPAIMAGDMNTVPGTPAHRHACSRMTDVARQLGDTTGTRTTLGMPLRIDYIFCSRHFACEDYRVLETVGSDHRPLLAVLRWKAEEAE